MAKKNIPPSLIITELFLVKADWQRTFMGEIRREADSHGKNIIMGKVIVVEGFICSISSEDDNELHKHMDELCTMKLDMGLHSLPGVTARILGEDYFLN
jgi:hypothetical protein